MCIAVCHWGRKQQPILGYILWLAGPALIILLILYYKNNTIFNTNKLLLGKVFATAAVSLYRCDFIYLRFFCVIYKLRLPCTECDLLIINIILRKGRKLPLLVLLAHEDFFCMQKIANLSVLVYVLWIFYSQRGTPPP